MRNWINPDERGGDQRTKQYKTLKQYFDERYIPEPNSGCWLWIGQSMATGYGVVNLQKQRILAHRTSYTLHKGDIAEGMHVCHTCDNPACVNPDHLWLGTHQDNHLDKINKGRASGGSMKGSAHPSHKINEDQVAEIKKKRQSGMTQTALAKMFGISQGQIWSILAGRNWAHVTGTACEHCAVGA